MEALLSVASQAGRGVASSALAVYEFLFLPPKNVAPEDVAKRLMRMQKRKGGRRMRAVERCTAILPIVLFVTYALSFLLLNDENSAAVHHGPNGDVQLTVLSRDIDLHAMRSVANRTLVFTRFVDGPRTRAFITSDWLRVSEAIGCESVERNISSIILGEDVVETLSPGCRCVPPPHSPPRQKK